MRLPNPASQPLRRQQPPSSSTVNSVSFVIVIILVLGCAATVFSYITLRRLRAQNRSPKYIPTSYLKQKWLSWSPQKKHGQANPGDRSRNLAMTNTSYNANTNGVDEGAAAGGVNRNTSVRSVITLPAYSQTPQDSEQVIGREGERAGMDTVVEFPETVDEEEAQREEQMESLYQIRNARRRELAEREARRQERRDARDQGNLTRLEELRRSSRSRAAAANLSNLSLNDSATNVSAATLLAEHQSRGRDRRISSVTYASVGHVRHDGSRVRASSNDSERGALLDGAAPMGEGQGRSRGISDVTIGSNLSQPMTRERSASSALSVSTTISDLDNIVPGQATPLSTQEGDGHRPRSSRSSDPTTSNFSPTTHRLTPDESTGSDEIAESTSLVETANATHDPRLPTYEQLDWGDAPAYSPTGTSSTHEVQSRAPRGAPAPIRLPSTAPRLPLLAPLPSINVELPSEPNTPATLEPEEAYQHMSR